MFLAIVVAEHMKVAALYRQVKLVALAYASEKSETFVSEGYHLHDDKITYYDASVLLKFVGSGTATQHEFMLLAELTPLRSNGNWVGRITACLASEALGCIVKFIHPVDKKARVKDASAVCRGRGRKVLTLVTTAGARRTCPPVPIRRCACVGRTVRRTRSYKKRRSPSLSTSSSTGCPLCLN